ncbi:N-acetylmuramoyl-L-alanine amidase [Streptomyces sp. TRM 70351]|uniref:N-acetylmuramoyl-L-alanine amidase n=1 Tax=Streptomyces sp. TRM 70351 TaxID=3116552 RepID=UPI002E7B9ACC|nr:N-acetylmuramoyl-L-alanine amidase [Streptomyces sp. TRM 70351]MEE1928567.1 N-acetylmuramoyl-L-alanine amidase [Streptomyces sp. TRM 70351]
MAVLAGLAGLCLAGALAWTSLRPDTGRDAGRAAGTSAGPEAGASPARSGDGRGEGRDRPGKRAPLHGAVVVLDPGHNPTNREHPRAIARQVDAGTHRKACDTTGTATNSGYPEAEFTLDVARRARALLEDRGATVVFTQDGDRPHGPCVDERARIGNAAKADAVVSVHADGAGEGQRGFHVILPAEVHAGTADTRAVTAPSRRLGEHLADRFAAATGTRPAAYLGPDTADTGLTVRDDLGGLNLTTVPKVFLECGNMRDARDAARFTDPAWRQRAALGVADGVTAFLTTPG